MDSWSFLTAAGLTALLCTALARALANLGAIPLLKPVENGRDPDCMVVIPARDEGPLIARAVRSLPPDSVIVVDDHSTDATAEAARKAGAGVILAPELPATALGKSNACLAGARLLQSRWILFADADTWFEQGFLRAACAAAEAHELAFLSIHLEARPAKWSDAILAPLAEAIYYAGIQPKSLPSSAFRGQCVLVRRTGYEFLGGHGAILNSLADDVKLALLAARHRLKFGAARAGTLGHASFRDAGASIRRRGYRLVLLDQWTLGATIVAAAAMALWPAAALWLALSDWRIAAALVAAPMALTLPWYRSAWVLLMPLAVYGLAARLWTGLVIALAGAKVEWKGRRI